MKTERIVISPPERRELNRRVRGRKIRAEDAKRARLILLLAKGESYSSICEKLGCSTNVLLHEERGALAELLPRWRLLPQ